MAGVKRKISEVEDSETQPIPSVKDLASSESKHRRQALTTILSHFKNRGASSALTSTQCLQIWRGFHVAVYMHDSKNAISVQNVISTVADSFNLIRAKDEQNEAQSINSDDVTHINGHNNATQNNGKDEIEGEEEFTGFDDDGPSVGNSNNDQTETLQAAEDMIDSSWLSIYTTAFWTTIIREWPTIDSHRMNKYLLLIRLVTRSLFSISIRAALASILATQPRNPAATSSSSPSSAKLKSSKPSIASKAKSKSKLHGKATSTSKDQDDSLPENSQDSQSANSNHIPTQTQLFALLTSQTGLLSLYPINPRDTKIPNGLRIHMLDIYIDELEKVINDNTTSAAETFNTDTDTATNTNKRRLGADILAMFKGPLERIAATGLDKNIRIKAREEITEFESRIESSG